LIVDAAPLFLEERTALFGFEDAFLDCSGSFGFLAAAFFPSLFGPAGDGFFFLLDGFEQASPGDLPVHGLGSRVLD